MDAIDFWKLCSEYSIIQAALLICGALPDDLQYEVETYDNRRPAGYVAVRTALYNAVRTERIPATVVEYDRDESGGAGSLNLHETLIAFYDLNRFLKAHGMVSTFFDRPVPDMWMDSERARYPPKLEAAIKAWTAVTDDPARLRGKSPKQALEAWLIEHAAELGLLNRKGEPNRNGIEEICKVANWKPEGGATPTPSASKLESPARTLIKLPDPRPTGRSSGPRESFSADLDDEIPF
jgi:hypothetical protein